ncbi:MAG: hypothetical protein WA477_09530 [Candidatus Sulfotelmatobacter sp.]
MTTDMALSIRLFLLRLAWGIGIVLLFALTSRAGGPKLVAGSSYFDPSTTGQPLVWPGGLITYYTDQGDLSPILPNASANSFVAGAFGVWTSVPTAALAASSGGSLAEDVNGSNVTVNSDGTISMPADIQPTATGTPVGIVYDYDGSVTDALLGQGAGDAGECFFNAVFGGDDNFGTFATYQHALIVINGQCVQQSSQLNDVEYRLVRAIGNVLGVGWSQLNVNVITGSPHPTADDYAGFPVMHFSDPMNCVPITRCYANPYQLSMDDTAATSRLYPVTAQNQSGFPGKKIFASTTARIHGSVYFTDSHGSATQPMQGVNVVARWIDPNTGQPSHRYTASSVSGFLFTGNAGNPITGFSDLMGNPFSDWGSTSSSVEGFFDLAGLAPPGTGAQYQLSIEALDPTWSAGVGSYSPGPVAPSGTASPITVTVTPGNDVEQDLLMVGSAQPLPQNPSSWSTPATMASSGDWNSSLSGYGDMQYFLVSAQSNRTLSVGVTALNESASPTESKAQPVIGMWSALDPPGTAPPVYTPSPFNELPFALTRLDVVVNAGGNFIVGISDLRGDGRPDYHYHAHFLYADSVSPSRIPVSGAPVLVQGIGFASGFTATIGNSAASQLATSSTQLTLSASAQGDGAQNLTISDPVSGASSTITNALIYGAAATDNIVLLSGLNPSTPVGVPAASPLVVRVLTSGGVPVGGATIGWNASSNVQLSACGGAQSCIVTSDQSGYASTGLTPIAVGVANITATLAPGVYSPSKSVSATLNAVEHSTDIGLLTSYVWISYGATVGIPITARVLSNGSPLNNVQVNFSIVTGTGTLSAGSALTNSGGYAGVTLNVNQVLAALRVSACVAPSNSPCSLFYANVVPSAQQVLEPISGGGQISTGQAFQPVIVRVTDSSSPPDAVMAAPVNFFMTVLRNGTGSGGNDGNPVQPVILAVSQTNTNSDMNGLANIVPSASGFGAPVEVDVSVTAGDSALDYPLQVLQPQLNQNTLPKTKIPPENEHRLHVGGVWDLR